MKSSLIDGVGTTADARPGADDQIRHRVLVVAPFAPSRSATHGAGRAMGGLVSAMACRTPTAVVHVQSDEDDVIDEETAAAIELVRSVPRPPPRRRRRQLAALLRGEPLWLQSWWSGELSATIARVIDQWQPDVVQVELDVMAPAVEIAERRGVPSVFVVHEPARSMAWSLAGRRLLGMLDRQAWIRTESRAQTTASMTVAFTDRDRALLTERDRPVEVIPIGADLPSRRISDLAAEVSVAHRSRDTVLFVGGSAHPPNVDAVTRLVRRILPRLVERRPGTRLVLIGDQCGREDLICWCADPHCDHLEVLGCVDDVAPHLAAAALVVAPLRLGGGMRVKVLDALAAGSPLVATSVALVGLDDAVAAGAARRADTDAEIVDALVALLDDPVARSDMRSRAADWARRHATWDARAEAYLALHRRVLRLGDEVLGATTASSSGGMR